MKKLIAVAVMGLFASGLFAQSFVLSQENLKEADKIGQKLNAQQQKADLSFSPANYFAPAKTSKPALTEEQKNSVKNNAGIFAAHQNLKKILSSKEYNAGFIFQGITDIMDAWNEGKKTFSADKLEVIAVILEEPVKTGYDKAYFVLSQYINVESCVIASRSPSFAAELEAFGAEVKATAKNAFLTKEEKNVLASVTDFKRVVSNMKDYDANYVLQSLVGIMDSWNDAKKTLAKAQLIKLAKEINKPVRTGFGTKIVPANFAYTEACVISSVSPSFGAEIESFGKEVMNFAK